MKKSLTSLVLFLGLSSNANALIDGSDLILSGYDRTIICEYKGNTLQARSVYNESDHRDHFYTEKLLDKNGKYLYPNFIKCLPLIEYNPNTGKCTDIKDKNYCEFLCC